MKRTKICVELIEGGRSPSMRHTRKPWRNQLELKGRKPTWSLQICWLVGGTLFPEKVPSGCQSSVGSGCIFLPACVSGRPTIAKQWDVNRESISIFQTITSTRHLCNSLGHQCKLDIYNWTPSFLYALPPPQNKKKYRCRAAVAALGGQKVCDGHQPRFEDHQNEQENIKPRMMFR